jgi:monoamine oxidase
MAEPSEISFVYVLDQIQAYQRAEVIFSLRPAHEQDRISGGMQRITERLAQQLRPQLNIDTPVLAMRQDEESVSAYSRGASFRAHYAIIAAPPAVAAQIYYEPALPSNRDALNQRVVMGRAIQAVLCYDYPFWRENQKSGFLMSDDGPASIIHDVSPTTSSEGALACVIIGDNASHWSAQPRSERLRALVTQLAGWFGNEALAYRGMIERDWNNERWSRGTVGFMPPGSASFVHTIGTPVGRIHWASSETATQWSGSIEGAIEAGERTAAEVIGQLSSAGLLRRNT